MVRQDMDKSENDLEELVKYAIENNCSDIHIKEGFKGGIRYKGLIKRSDTIIGREQIIAFAEKNIPNRAEAIKALANGNGEKHIDLAFNFCGRRFRANIYRDMYGCNAAIRLLSDVIPSFDELLVPMSVKEFTKSSKGFVIVSGATGSGKSTTLASLIDIINREAEKTVLSLEDPIEYIHKPQKAWITQREVGTDVASFAEGTKDALRQDPDVILVGEMRDYDTMSNALTLADTGHLVFATLHTNSAVECIDRIVTTFPAGQQEQARSLLADTLSGVVHQSLIRSSVKPIRVPLCEVMCVDDSIRGMIRQHNNPNAIYDYMRSRHDIGNVHIVDNAISHIRAGRLKNNDVMRYMSPPNYELLCSVVGGGRGSARWQ